MTIGRVVADLAIPAAHDNVGFGWMEVAARRVHAQRPSRPAELFPGRQAERMAEDVRNHRPIGDEGGLRSAVEGAEGIRLRGPIEVAERPGEPREMMLRAVVVAVNRASVVHDAMCGLVSFMRRSISSIACVVWARRRWFVVGAS